MAQNTVRKMGDETVFILSYNLLVGTSEDSGSQNEASNGPLLISVVGR